MGIKLSRLQSLRSMKRSKQSARNICLRKKKTRSAFQRKESMFANLTPLHKRLHRKRFNTSASPRIPKELNSREWLSKVILSKDAIYTLQALREPSLSQRNARKLDLEY